MKFKLFFDKIVLIQKKYKIISNGSLLVLFITVNSLRIENEDILLDFNNTKQELIQTKSEVRFLKANVISYNRSLENFPFPIWQKKKVGGQFIIQYVNPEYVKIFGHLFGGDVYNVIGKNNFQLGYPTAIAQSFYENDIAVAITGNPLRTIEQYNDNLNINKKIKVIKWKEMKANDTLINGMVYEFLDNE